MSEMLLTEWPLILWNEHGEEKSARWRSESGMPPPKRVEIADDRIKADEAYRLACAGTALLWRGDFQNARQLLQALARRTEGKPRKIKKIASTANGHGKPIHPVHTLFPHPNPPPMGEGTRESLRELTP